MPVLVVLGLVLAVEVGLLALTLWRKWKWNRSPEKEREERVRALAEKLSTMRPSPASTSTYPLLSAAGWKVKPGDSICQNPPSSARRWKRAPSKRGRVHEH